MTRVVDKPISSGVEALPHTPIYRMHRYFARRPHNVISALVKHYSCPGDVILDPFCGGGTTVVEGLRLRRKVIGVDLNPMATLITLCEVMNLDLEEVGSTLCHIAEATRQEINTLYQVPCPECGAEATTDWAKWSVTYICPHCAHATVAAEAEKVGPGKYQCANCEQEFRVTNLPRKADRMLHQHVSCLACGFEGIKQATEEDVRRSLDWERRFDSIVEQEGLWYPQQTMPFDYELRKPNNLVCERFGDFFSSRNLIALARLRRRIHALADPEMRYFLMHVFSSVVDWTNRMITDERHGWALHAYWLPDIYCENNVWNILRRRAKWAMRGKRYSQEEIGEYFAEAQSADDIFQGNATCWLLTQSSTSLPLPDRSVDTVVTDPPYGGNVQYSELTSFWAVWLPEILGTDGPIESPEEAVMKRYKEGEAERYERLLGRVFLECHRVLKDTGWLVITFNNRDADVWAGMLSAARQAGFQLASDGIVYQEPIADYTRTLHQMKDGAIKGDFILSFCKEADVAQAHPHSQNLEGLAIELVTEVLEDGPATLSQIYQEVIPALVSRSASSEELEPFDLENVLVAHFVPEEVPIEAQTDGPFKKTVELRWMLPIAHD